MRHTQVAIERNWARKVWTLSDKLIVKWMLCNQDLLPLGTFWVFLDFENISHWQPVPPYFDPVSASTDQYHPILTQYYQETTSAALYRPSTIKYQSVPPNTDPVPPSTNK